MRSFDKKQSANEQPTLAQLFRDLKPFIALGAKYRWRFALCFLLSLVVLVSSIGLLGLSGWFITATAVAGLTITTAQAFNFFTPGAAVRGFSIARTASRYGERLSSHDATFRLLAGLRVWFFTKIEPLVPSGLGRVRHSELLNRLVADIDTLDGLYLRMIAPLLLAVVAVFGVVALAFFFEMRAGWFLLVVLVPTLWWLPSIFFRSGHGPGQNLITTREQLRNRMMDYVAGQAELQIYGASARYQERILHAEKRMLNHEWQMAQLNGLAMLLIALLIGLTLGGIIWFGAADIAGAIGQEISQQDGARQSHVHGPIIVMLALATLAAFEAIVSLPAAFQIMGQTQGAARRLLDITEQKPAVTFPQQTVDDVLFTGATLALDKVSFHYPGGNSILEDFSLNVVAGERVALIGPTGCGKSTLLQLITREWPCSGMIALGDVPTEALSEHQLRRVMAVMPQRIHLFSTSLRDNLLLAVDPVVAKAISDEDLLAVLAEVGLDHIAPAETLLDTWLGSVGQALSGGEQRRLGLARVLLRLRDPKCTLVLLDEPTEGLDPETEQRMIAVLERALVGKSLLMVTHRPAVLALVQRSIVLSAKR